MFPDSKVQGPNMGPNWVLSAPDGPHVGPMNLAIRVAFNTIVAADDFSQCGNYAFVTTFEFICFWKFTHM